MGFSRNPTTFYPLAAVRNMLPEGLIFCKSNAVFGCKGSWPRSHDVSWFVFLPATWQSFVKIPDSPWLEIDRPYQDHPISFESNTHYLHWVSRQPPLLGLYSVMFFHLSLDQHNQWDWGSSFSDIQHLAESVDGGCRSCLSMMAT